MTDNDFFMVNKFAYGSNADLTVFAASVFGKAWIHTPTKLNIREGKTLPDISNTLPFVIIADEGFALKTTVMRSRKKSI